jgi:protein phosphatase
MSHRKVRLAWATDVGRRSHQEDNYLVRELPTGALIAVADGMGGHAAGEVASEIAVKALTKVDASVLSGDDAPEALADAASDASREIEAYGREVPSAAGLGTTLVAALITDHQLVVGHAGDSRAWLVTANGVEQLTKDHSAVQVAVDRGALTEEEAATSPYRNIICRNLGDGSQERLEMCPKEGRLEPADGTVVLLTSDGAHDYLSEEEMLQHLMGSGSLEEGLEQLLRCAYHNGSQDNITLVACEIGELPRHGAAVSPPPIEDQPEPSARPQVQRAGASTAVRVALVLLALVVLTAILAALLLVSPGRDRELPTGVPETGVGVCGPLHSR